MNLLNLMENMSRIQDWWSLSSSPVSSQKKVRRPYIPTLAQSELGTVETTSRCGYVILLLDIFKARGLQISFTYVILW